MAELRTLEKLQRYTPCYDPNKRHPCKVGYVRYADDFVALVSGTKTEAEEVMERIRAKLQLLGLQLSEEKTKLTHWRETVTFLGYNIRGRLRRGGVQIRAVLSIPKEKATRIRREIRRVCKWHHVPEADAMVRVSVIYRGWCNYYRYADAPQRVFNHLAQYTWWEFAHFLARKRKASIAQVIQQSVRAGQRRVVAVQGRKRRTFTMEVGGKQIALNIIPPETKSIWKLGKVADGNADSLPVIALDWALGRSLETRLTAQGRSNGLCELCQERPATEVHHPRPLRNKSLRGRVSSDAAQRESAVNVCLPCHTGRHKRTAFTGR